MRNVREAIADGTFQTFSEEFLRNYRIIPHDVRAANREKREARGASHNRAN